MSRDISSSSSSEDEAHDSPPQSSVKPPDAGTKTCRYQCPSDFVSLCHKPCTSTLTDSVKDSNNELWLIKVPTGFDPSCLSGMKVPLSGFQSVKAKRENSSSIYSILASTQGTSELRLLTSSSQSGDSMSFGPAFSGLLNISETFGDSSTNVSPHLILATPAPSVPPGLKQRFQPFGSRTPAVSSTAGGHARTHPSKRLATDDGVEEEDEGRRKKKKRKKDKHTELEPAEDVKVKEEPGCDAAMVDIAAVDGSLQGGEGEDERKRRKKKKKRTDKAREELAQEVKNEEVEVKCEPVDPATLDTSGKKKKKKKKSKMADE